MRERKNSQNSNGRSSAGKIAQYGLLIALAFIFSYVEALIPLPVPVPGIKLGLANLVNVVGLYTVGAAGTLVVGLLRIVMVGFTFSNPGSMLYALAGGILSLAVMALAKKMDWFEKTGVSILGGVFHNIGQLSMAAWITGTAGVFSYLPVLLVAGVITGGVIGLLGGLVTDRIAPAVRECAGSAKASYGGAAEICRYGKDYSMELWMKTDYTEKRSCETGQVRNTDPRAGWQQKHS